MRRTKIICTIGPASDSEEMLEKLILAGMNVARFNFSHGTHEEAREKFDRLKRVCAKLKSPVAFLQDTKGPEIRLRDFEGGKVQLVRGQKFTLTTDDILGDAGRASITYQDLPKDVSVGGAILIDDGLIELHVDNVSGTEIECTVVNGGPVSNHKGVNVPGAELSMPFISDTDRSDLEFGAELGYDYIAASFTRTADDVLAIREILDAKGSKAKIIAKIENMQGVNNLEAILDAADGIMVARGDLGVEVPLEEVPVLQKKMIRMAAQKGKICVTATQMLDSMMKNPRPTRAESTDVANAIYDGTTAIMLSGETASGAYPEEAVRTMSRIAERTEEDLVNEGLLDSVVQEDLSDVTSAISAATCGVAEDVGAKKIITVTMSGFTARRLSAQRPACGIVACTPNVDVGRQMNLLFGVHPVIIPQVGTEEGLFEEAIKASMLYDDVVPDDKIVLTAGVPLGVAGSTNMIRVFEVYDPKIGPKKVPA